MTYVSTNIGSKADREMIRRYEWPYWDNQGNEMDKKQFLKFSVLIVTYEGILADAGILSRINWK